MSDTHPKIDAKQLAHYLLAKVGHMSHLKLQKLLYYVQAWHLVFFDTPIIEDDFKAWVHGPVCLSVWHDLKDVAILNGEVQIPSSTARADVVKRTEGALVKDQIQLIDSVLAEYGKRTAFELECLTHEESPWREARAGIPPEQPSSKVISQSAMRRFYRARLAASRRN